MVSDRLQRRIYRILEQLEDAADRGEWTAVLQGSQDVLIFDPENADARNFLVTAQRALDAGPDFPTAVDT